MTIDLRLLPFGGVACKKFRYSHYDFSAAVPRGLSTLANDHILANSINPLLFFNLDGSHFNSDPLFFPRYVAKSQYCFNL